MIKLSNKITWFLFLLMGWLILMVNGCKSKKMHSNFIRELLELCKKHSKYTVDSDWELRKKE